MQQPFPLQIDLDYPVNMATEEEFRIIWLAVLERAVLDSQPPRTNNWLLWFDIRHAHQSGARNLYQFCMVYTWLSSNDFVQVCENAELNHQSVKNIILEQMDATIAVMPEAIKARIKTNASRIAAICPRDGLDYIISRMA